MSARICINITRLYAAKYTDDLAKNKLLKKKDQDSISSAKVNKTRKLTKKGNFIETIKSAT